jgi:hypothetical protein
VPLDHQGVPIPSLLALYERGMGRFCAFGSGPCKTLAEELAASPNPTAIRSFTLEGHPLAPVVGHDDEGKLFGLVDAQTSVLRVERTPPGGTPRFDLRYLRQDGSGQTDPSGPVTVPRGTVFNRKFWAARCDPVALAGFRATDELLTWADAQDLTTVHRRGAAGRKCGNDTGKKTARVDLGYTATEPAIEASADVAAFLAVNPTPSQPPLLRVCAIRNSSVQQRTPNQSRSASLRRAVNRYPIAIEAGLAYFREEPGGILTAFDPTIVPKDKGFIPIRSVERATVVGDHVIALDPSSGQAWVATPSSPPKNLPGIFGALVANGGDVVAVATLPDGKVTAWPWATASTAPGTATGMVADDLGAVRTCAGTVCATPIVLVTPEAKQGKDLNGDGDTADRVLQFYDPQTLKVTSSGYAVSGKPEEDVVAAGSMVAFRVPEAGQAAAGVDLNHDTDRTDDVLHLLVFEPPGNDRAGVASRQHWVGRSRPGRSVADPRVARALSRHRRRRLLHRVRAGAGRRRSQRRRHPGRRARRLPRAERLGTAGGGDDRTASPARYPTRRHTARRLGARDR